MMVQEAPEIKKSNDEGPEIIEGFFLVPEKTLASVLKCQKPKEERILVYEHKSVFIFDHRTILRQSLVNMIHNPVFEYTIILAILVNSLLLAIYDYKDRDNLTEYN